MKDYQIKIIAPAKINYILEVRNKREDNYHEILTIFQTISLYDVLYFKETPRDIVFASDSDKTIPDESNLVYKATDLLKRVLNINKGASIFLEKHIPIGAGLGGGSSDAAATLKGITRLWGLKLKKEDLYKYATQLGADVPFFIEGGIAIGRGKGEKITPISRGAKPKIHIALVCPDIQISTRSAYKIWDEENFVSRSEGIDSFLKALYLNDINGMADNLFNDFEPLIIEKYPIIGKIKNILSSFGALGTLMTGSGSSVYGIFDDESTVDEVVNKVQYMGKVFKVHTI